MIDEKSELEKTARIDRERLSQLERAGFVSEISSMIAHELRQPVASLINYADGLSLYLGGRGKDPVIDEATREITKQAERVASIVDRVRAYAKIVKRRINRWICATLSNTPSGLSARAATSPVFASSLRFRQKRLFRAMPWSLSSSWSIASKTPFCDSKEPNGKGEIHISLTSESSTTQLSGDSRSKTTVRRFRMISFAHLPVQSRAKRSKGWGWDSQSAARLPNVTRPDWNSRAISGGLAVSFCIPAIVSTKDKSS